MLRPSDAARAAGDGAEEEFVETLDGTMVFADVSGFTRLSERLARSGKEGAEHLVDAINACFSALLADAYERGGSLLKFGGDAMLLWFEGEEHVERALRLSGRDAPHVAGGRADSRGRERRCAADVGRESTAATTRCSSSAAHTGSC